MMTFYTKRKNYIVILMVICMTLSLSACGKGNSVGNNTNTDAVYGDKKNSVFEVDNSFESSIPKDFNTERMKTSKDNIFIIASKYTENAASESDTSDDASGDASAGDAASDYADEYSMEYDGAVSQTEYKLFCTDIYGGNLKELEIPDVKGDDIYIDSLYVSPSGLAAVGINASSYKDDEYNSTAYIAFYDKDQKLECVTDMSDIFYGNEEEYIMTSLLGNDGNLIIFTDMHIYIYDNKGNEISKTDFKGSIGQSAFTSDGRVIVEDSGDYDSKGIKLSIVDLKTGKMEEACTLDLDYFISGESLMNGDETADFYYRSDKGIFAYNLNDEEAEKIVDYNASDINDSVVTSICIPDRDTLIMLQYKSDYSGNEIVKYTKVDPENVKEKKSITIMTYMASEGLKTRAYDFNKKNNEYRIDVVDYSDEDDPEAAMSTDIAAGKVPDIYDISQGIGKMSVAQAVEKGLLENLDPYLENDPVISRDDILPNVIEAGRIGDGVYTVSSDFAIISLAAKKSEIGDRDGWTFTEMKEYVDSKDDDVILLDYTDKESLLDMFVTADIDEFVDWQTGECHFDTDDFKALLQICNRGDKEVDYSEDINSNLMIREGKQLFKQLYMYGYDVEVENKLYNNDICYVGFPNINKKGTYASFYNSYAISSESENKEACWEFIRQFLTYEYQSEAVSKEIIYSIPTRKDVFEEYLRKYTTTEQYTDAYGNTVYPLDEEMGVGGDISIKVKPLSKKEEEQFRDIINKATKTLYYNSDLTSIIKEEATRYFNGDKTVDETAEIIQNRMTIYINESR